jgi:hypothetical protein
VPASVSTRSVCAQRSRTGRRPACANARNHRNAEIALPRAFVLRAARWTRGGERKNRRHTQAPCNSGARREAGGEILVSLRSERVAVRKCCVARPANASMAAETMSASAQRGLRGAGVSSPRAGGSARRSRRLMSDGGESAAAHCGSAHVSGWNQCPALSSPSSQTLARALRVVQAGTPMSSCNVCVFPGFRRPGEDAYAPSPRYDPLAADLPDLTPHFSAPPPAAVVVEPSCCAVSPFPLPSQATTSALST